jgi:hypothetical protein
MSDQNPNRVLSRTGARELTEHEMHEVNGARTLGTLTACTFALQALDGDIHEC